MVHAEHLRSWLRQSRHHAPWAWPPRRSTLAPRPRRAPSSVPARHEREEHEGQQAHSTLTPAIARRTSPSSPPPAFAEPASAAASALEPPPTASATASAASAAASSAASPAASAAASALAAPPTAPPASAAPARFLPPPQSESAPWNGASPLAEAPIPAAARPSPSRRHRPTAPKCHRRPEARQGASSAPRLASHPQPPAVRRCPPEAPAGATPHHQRRRWYRGCLRRQAVRMRPHTTRHAAAASALPPPCYPSPGAQSRGWTRLVWAPRHRVKRSR